MNVIRLADYDRAARPEIAWVVELAASDPEKPIYWDGALWVRDLDRAMRYARSATFAGAIAAKPGGYRVSKHEFPPETEDGIA